MYNLTVSSFEEYPSWVTFNIMYLSQVVSNCLLKSITVTLNYGCISSSYGLYSGDFLAGPKPSLIFFQNRPQSTDGHFVLPTLQKGDGFEKIFLCDTGFFFFVSTCVCNSNVLTIKPNLRNNVDKLNLLYFCVYHCDFKTKNKMQHLTLI